MEHEEVFGEAASDTDGCPETEPRERDDFALVDCSEPRGGGAEGEEQEQTAKTRTTAVPVPVTPQQRQFIQNDVADFVAKYPGFGPDELSALENNPKFRQFCGTRFGREPLAELYGDYLSVVECVGAAAVSKAAKKTARSTGGGTAGSGTLTPAQREVLSAWNAEHPEMKMTAKEFLKR